MSLINVSMVWLYLPVKYQSLPINKFWFGVLLLCVLILCLALLGIKRFKSGQELEDTLESENKSEEQGNN